MKHSLLFLFAVDSWIVLVGKYANIIRGLRSTMTVLISQLCTLLILLDHYDFQVEEEVAMAGTCAGRRRQQQQWHRRQRRRKGYYYYLFIWEMVANCQLVPLRGIKFHIKVVDKSSKIKTDCCAEHQGSTSCVDQLVRYIPLHTSVPTNGTLGQRNLGNPRLSRPSDQYVPSIPYQLGRYSKPYWTLGFYPKQLSYHATSNIEK